MKRLEAHIRKLANEDIYDGWGSPMVRSDPGVLFRYFYLWLFLPVWGPAVLVYAALSALGRKLR